PAHPGSWLGDYLPGLRELDARQMPPIDAYTHCLGDVMVSPVPIPHDCLDGFLYAFWRRPEAYLDPAVRTGSSSFRLLAGLDGGLRRLADDLASGAWDSRHGDLRELEEYDAGY